MNKKVHKLQSYKKGNIVDIENKIYLNVKIPNYITKTRAKTKTNKET